MEQNLQILPKKVRSVLRVFYFMLRKGIFKKKLWSELHMMMKRAKILGKAFHNLMFHRHHNWAAFATASHQQNDSHHLSFHSPDDDDPPDESDISCTASPFLSPFSNKAVEGIDMMAFNGAVLKDMETGSPGFRRSPMVRQLRVTDSPFPVSSEDNHVDEEAEQFIIQHKALFGLIEDIN